MNRILVSCILCLSSACATAHVVEPENGNLDASQWEVVRELKIPAKPAPLKNDGIGQIIVKIVDDLPGTIVGKAHSKKPCKPWIEIEKGAPETVLAHEIGHILWALHSPDAPSDFMAPNTNGTNKEITEEQRYFMKAGAIFLKICRRAAKKKK